MMCIFVRVVNVYETRQIYAESDFSPNKLYKVGHTVNAHPENYASALRMCRLRKSNKKLSNKIGKRHGNARCLPRSTGGFPSASDLERGKASCEISCTGIV